MAGLLLAVCPSMLWTGSTSGQESEWLPWSKNPLPGSVNLVEPGGSSSGAEGLQDPLTPQSGSTDQQQPSLEPPGTDEPADAAQQPKEDDQEPAGSDKIDAGEDPAKEANDEPTGVDGGEGESGKEDGDKDEEKSLADRIKELEDEREKAAEDKKKKAEEDAAKPTVKPRGRLHLDAGWFSQNDANRIAVGDLQDGVIVRRARLGFDAKAFQISEYRLDFEMGTAGGRPSIFDAYGRLTQIPGIGNLQVGHFREPFSLEALTSSNWLTFMERGFNTTFDPARNLGVMAFNHSQSENLMWAVGVFREGSDVFGDDIGDSGERAVTGRVSWLPWFEECGDSQHFLALGTSLSDRDPDNRFTAGPGSPEESLVRYQGRIAATNEDGIGLTPAFIQTTVNDATGIQLVGFDASWNIGRVNLQSEYTGSLIDRLGTPSVWFHGTYVQASCFLTGESRQYDRKIGLFTRAKVARPYIHAAVSEDGCRGPGAWEVALRWNYLDLSDKDISGGYIDGTTIGLNWYLSPYTRLMFNYGLNDLHDPVDGRSAAQWLGTRLDVHF